jgi:hypothetical protein
MPCNAFSFVELFWSRFPWGYEIRFRRLELDMVKKQFRLLIYLILFVLICSCTSSDFQKSYKHWVQDGWGIKNFDKWHFRTGARFGDKDIWWVSKTGYVRKYPHEGVDFVYYQLKGDKKVHSVEGNQPIPLILTGALITRFKDYLGESLLFKTDIESKGRYLYILYAHVEAVDRPKLQLNKRYSKGSVLFEVAPLRSGGVNPHLHLTTFWGPPKLDPEKIDWDYINESPEITLIDPFRVEMD